MGRHAFVLAVLAWLVLAFVPAGSGATPQTAALDVVLAIDGTASMKSSIAQAKRDGERLVARLREVSPELRVGVAVFRDFGNPAGEYALLQPLTGDVTSVNAALERVEAVSNPHPSNSVAESYSLMFRKTYTDEAIAWRAGARRVVVVIGDAEPYAAGSGGLAGCNNDARDPRGMSAATELAQMRTNGIVLLLVRQVSPETTASLACYESLASRGALGSAARDGGGSNDLVEPIVTLTKQVFAPLQLRPDAIRPAQGKKVRYRLTLTNRSAVPMRVSWLRARLPRALRYDATSTAAKPKRRNTSRFSYLIWYLNRSVAPGRSITIAFSAQPTRPGRYRVTARGLARLQGGLTVDVDARAAEVLAR